MKRLTLLMSFIMMCLASFADLQKDEMDYYLIGSPSELKEFTLLVRSGNTSINAKLTADIDMEGVIDFIPIGYFSDEDNHVKQRYSGTVNGNGFVIKNLAVTMDDSY